MEQGVYPEFFLGSTVILRNKHIMRCVLYNNMNTKYLDSWLMGKGPNPVGKIAKKVV